MTVLPVAFCSSPAIADLASIGVDAALPLQPGCSRQREAVRRWIRPEERGLEHPVHDGQALDVACPSNPDGHQGQHGRNEDDAVVPAAFAVSGHLAGGPCA
jgi:hypothetical protein